MNNKRGFTLVEILMVLILIAILAAVAVNAFINFRTEARDAASQANLAALRASITAQYAQMQLRCGTAPGTFPAFASLVANDITDGNSTCTGAMVTVASEQRFLQGGIPDSPWSDPLNNTITNCQAFGGNACERGVDTVACDGSGTYTDEWCYNPTTGEIWIDGDPAVNNRESW